MIDTIPSNRFEENSDIIIYHLQDACIMKLALWSNNATGGEIEITVRKL